jgi:hypothetical protein
MTTAILFLLAFQAGTVHPTPARQPRFQGEASSPALPDFATESQQEENSVFEEHEFMQRLNGLSKALHDFAAIYKTGEVDLRKVKAVRKAMHELEKSDWFRPQRRRDRGVWKKEINRFSSHTENSLASYGYS